MASIELDFRILGPVDVRADAVRLDLGGPKRRALLFVLLVNANRAVAVPQLLNAMWGPNPPPSALANLRTYFAELRRLLRNVAGTDRLVARDGGYLILIEPVELDLCCFEVLVSEGHAALADRNASTAVRVLREGLALWRGQAAEGLSCGPDIESEIARLNDARIAATEDYAEGLISLGEYGPAVTELRRLVAAHPFRERAWSQLMVALYRSGDPAAALTAYRGARQQLVEELGVEPAVELQRLHQAILGRDPALSGPPRQVTEVATPAELPPAVPTFVGRDGEIARLTALFTGAHPAGASATAVVHGLAGTGKTALATELARRLARHFPDGCLYADLNGAAAGGRPRDPATVLARFLRGVGGSEGPALDLDESAARFRSALAGRRALVVLDDAASVAQVRPLLPASSRCGVLITSRHRLFALDGAVRILLPLLPVEAAVALLRRLLGDARVDVEPDAAEAIAGYCGYLPLALRIAGERLNARPAWRLRDLADRLADETRRLDELSIGDIAVRAGFHGNYAALDERAAEAFRGLGGADLAEFSTATAATLLGLSEPATEAVLERLVDGHLLQTSIPARYQLPALLRLFAREEARMYRSCAAHVRWPN